jgi:hypothetical protein
MIIISSKNSLKTSLKDSHPVYQAPKESLVEISLPGIGVFKGHPLLYTFLKKTSSSPCVIPPMADRQSRLHRVNKKTAFLKLSISII